MGIVLAALSAMMFGAADFSGGFATRKSAVYAVLVVSQLFGLLLGTTAALVSSAGPVAAGDLLWGMAAGVAGAFGLAMLYSGLAKGIIAVVSPVAAVVGAAIPVIAGLALGEAPKLTGWIGIAVSIPAIALLSWEPMHHAARRRIRSSTIYGALAGVGFGAFFVLISRPEASAGMWPLVAARGASITLVTVVTLATGRSLKPNRESMPAIVAAGCFDMGANIAFVLAARFYLLSVVSVVSSLYPAPTVLLGRIILRERLSVARVAGLLSAIVGVALMSV